MAATGPFACIFAFCVSFFVGQSSPPDPGPAEVAEPAPYVEPYLGRWQTAASSTCHVALEVYRDSAGNVAFDLKGQSLVRSGAANVSGTELLLSDVGAMQYDDATPSLGMSNIDENNSRRFGECKEDYLFFLRAGN